MVAMMMIESDTDVHTPKGIQGRELFSITDLLQLCEDQNNLLREEDEQIGRFIAQLSEYELELYEKDAHIKKLEDELSHTLRGSNERGTIL
jgi:hypothetical protein